MAIVGVVGVIWGVIALLGENQFGWVPLVAGIVALIQWWDREKTKASAQTRDDPTPAPAPAPAPAVPTKEAPAQIVTLTAHKKAPAVKKSAKTSAVRASSARPAVKSQVTKPAAAIVTRTEVNRNGAPLLDPYVDRDRDWTDHEDRRLLIAFTATHSVIATATRLQIDQRQVAIRLARLVFDAEGELNEPLSAFQHRTRWSTEEAELVVARIESGETLISVSASIGRTPLAVAWRLLERHGHIAQPSARTRSRLGLSL